MSSDLKSRQAAANKIMDSLPVNDCEPLSTLFSEKELLECVHVGVTTFFKFRVVLKQKPGVNDGRSPDSYALASTGLPSELLRIKYKEDCFISFRITEDSGYVANIALTPAKTYQDMKLLFQKNLSRKKLKGKFQLEVLFVDAKKIGYLDLCEKYVANINSRMKIHSDITSLIDKVKKAEKWYDNLVKLARKQKEHTAKNVVSNMPQTPPKSKRTSQTLLVNCSRFPSMELSDSYFIIRTHLCLPEGMFDAHIDMPAAYATFGMKIFDRYCSKNMSSNTFTMFEFQTNDGHIITSKLRPHAKHGEEMISSVIKEHDIPREAFSNLYTVTIYCVDIPAFGTANKALSRINFIKKALEKMYLMSDVPELTKQLPDKMIDRKRPIGIVLDECTKPIKEKCKCEKLHLSDYCTPKLVLEKRSDRIVMQRWSILLSDFTIKLYTWAYSTHIQTVQIKWASPLYAMIGNRICQNTFSKECKVGTNIQFEIKIGEKMYTSKLRHHSDVGEKRINEDMFKEESSESIMEVTGEVSVTVYMVDILEFETNKEAHECVNNFSMGKYEAEINKNLKPEPIVTHKEPPAKIVLLMNGLFPSTTLNSSFFKIGSNLSNKASTDLLKLNEAYEVLSSRTTIDTSKSKILLFLIEIDSQFHRDARSPLLLMANICLEIVSKNEVLLGKKKKITVKFHLGNNLVQVVLNEEFCWNATLLMVDMCKESFRTIEVPKKFYLEVHYRLMKKEDMF